MKRLFGTDGIRAVAGEPPLDPSTVRKLGAALARVLGTPDKTLRVVIGRDTRESGVWLRDAVTSGIHSRGGSAVDIGIVTTPGLAFTAQQKAFDAGIMISASHNPYHDNGIKVFGHDGTKIPDDVERDVEALVLDPSWKDPGPDPRRASEVADLVREYVAFLEGSILPRGRLAGLRIALDCANGSASVIAPEVFRYHGAEIRLVGAAPDGRNINLGCGSLHVGALSDVVRGSGCDFGFAFDGDADRTLSVDRHGRVMDGDHILFLMARRMKRSGELRNDTVVATVMSNFWLERRLQDEGVRLLRAPVGDKYVLEKMIEADAELGGEQSGHVIFRNRSTTGDGILTALLVSDALLDEQEPLERFLDGIVPCPQVLLNVRVREKPDLREHPEIGPLVDEIEHDLEGTGRIVLRYSGTEPLARVMVEGTDAAAVQRHAERVAGEIRRLLGAD
jgi:phosphoglucosamine mutase